MDNRPVRKRRRRRRRLNPRFLLMIEVILLIVAAIWVITMISGMGDDTPDGTVPPETTTSVETTVPTTTVDNSPEGIIRAFAADNNLSFWDYPVKVVEMLEKNPETKDFVLGYPLKYGQVEDYNISDYKDVDGVPLFMQWDTRWGYFVYGNDALGFTGCGPTTLAMVAYYFTGDEEMTPDKVAQFAIDNGYCAPGNGSYWALIADGAEKLGLKSTELPLDENKIIKNVQAGNPVICIMGPGAFTTSGHFIAIVGYEDGKFIINDCNSYANSQRLWEYDEFYDQINNLWAIKKG